jgi:hypothetical protein
MPVLDRLGALIARRTGQKQIQQPTWFADKKRRDPGTTTSREHSYLHAKLCYTRFPHIPPLHEPRPLRFVHMYNTGGTSTLPLWFAKLTPLGASSSARPSSLLANSALSRGPPEYARPLHTMSS